MQTPKIYYEEDANLALIQNKKIAVIGYGSQGHAHALNLKDSGMDVVVGLREDSTSKTKAEAEGLKVVSVAEASQWADIVMMLTPDQHQKKIYTEEIVPYLEAGNTLCVAHGFSIHFEQVIPPKDIDVIMIAPKGPGHLVRRTYQEGSGVPCLVAVYQDVSQKAFEIAMAWAKGIGGARAGVIFTNFKDETETDLFGEQAVLCGGISELIRAGFDTLVEAGYPAHIAYFECLHEVKLIVDLMYEGGISGMNYSVSETAEYGGMLRSREVIGEEARKSMKNILAKVQDGSFAKQWIAECESGGENFQALRKKDANHPIEKVGLELRKMFSWLKKSS